MAQDSKRVALLGLRLDLARAPPLGTSPATPRVHSPRALMHVLELVPSEHAEPYVAEPERVSQDVVTKRFGVFCMKRNETRYRRPSSVGSHCALGGPPSGRHALVAAGFAGHGGVSVLAIMKRGGATASESLGTARTDLVASARPEHMRHPTSRRDS